MTLSILSIRVFIRRLDFVSLLVCSAGQHDHGFPRSARTVFRIAHHLVPTAAPQISQTRIAKPRRPVDTVVRVYDLRSNTNNVLICPAVVT